MTKNLLFLFLVLASCNQASKKPAPVNVKFSNTIVQGEKTIVLYFLNTECPICRKYQGNFKHTFQTYHNRYDFYYVFPGKQTEQDIINFCKYDSIPFMNIVTDETCEVSETFGAEITPQVIVISPAAGKNVIYTGKIDDRFQSIRAFKQKATVNYIEKALNSLQKNEAVEISETKPVGCFIEPR